MKKFTCIIPFYEGGSTIRRALDSVLWHERCGQVIVVSDGSPEPLRPHLNSKQLMLEEEGRIRVLELRNNLGQGGARNLGASISTTPYICFLDQDDEYLSDFFSVCLDYLDKNVEIAAVQTNAEFSGLGGTILNNADPRYRMVIDSVPWNLMMRRVSFWMCGGFPVDTAFRSEAAGEDIAFKSALRFTHRILEVDVIGVRHHIRCGSATDRFLKRTEAEHGMIRFKAVLPNEADGSLELAMQEHFKRVLSDKDSAWKNFIPK
jgi:glycosyltransferase involved in cell wall biosynthesis